MAAQQPAPATRYSVGSISLSRLFMFVAAVLFVIAALIAGGVFSGDYLPWTLGGFASVALAWAL